MMRAFELSHLLLRQCLEPGDWVVDATVGNGHDTLFLANLVGAKGRVFGFDVQEAALVAAAERLKGLSQVTLIHDGHEHMSERLPQREPVLLAAVMFNLGYLPGGPKDIVTRTETTLKGLNQALTLVKMGGLVTLVLYPGHEGGDEEAEAVRSHVQGLSQSFAASRYARINSLHPSPELIVVERIS